MRYILVIIPLLSITFAHAQSAKFSDAGALIIRDSSHRINLNDISEPIDEVPTAPCVHAIQKRNQKYYILVTTSHFTRGYPPRGGAGGCGEEALITWLCIDNGKVLEKQDYKYRSWTDNREGGIDGWKGPVFAVTTQDLLENKLEAKDKSIWQDITYSYDILHPEKGISEVKSAPHE